MKGQRFLEREPFEVELESQGVGRTGRWIRQGRKIVVLPAIPAQNHLLEIDESELGELPDGGLNTCKPGEGPPAVLPDPEGKGPHPLVYKGVTRLRSRNPTVGDAQILLNRFLKQLKEGAFPFKPGADLSRIQAIRQSLTQDPLAVDCQFGGDTEKVTLMFQRAVFPDNPNGWDGKIGPNTWRELIKLRQSPPPPPPPPIARTQVIKIVVKSFIAPIGTRIGSPTCSLLVLPLPPPAPPIPTFPSTRLAALAAATDAAYSENPLTDLQDKGYRLLSECTLSVTCQDGRLDRVTPSPLVTDAGKECIPQTGACLQPPPLIASTVRIRTTGPSTFEFFWTAKGRPHLAAEPAFQLVCPRTSVFIWHTISGEIDCSGPSPRVTSLALNGSQFPSHRVFVDGRIVSGRTQGDFQNLWVADPADPIQVK